MPSSTSSFERELPAQRWGLALAVALVVAALSLAGWEMVWRAQGYDAAAQNTNGLWAHTARRLDDESDATVVVGASRILFDLHLGIWADELETTLPVQLALEGTSPRPFLHALAEDERFRGFVLVGVTPGLFFSPRAGFRADALEHLRKETPSQRLGQALSMRLERAWVFLDPEAQLFTRFDRADWPVRSGMKPPFREPRRLMQMNEHRQADMWRRVVEDAAYQKEARDIWLAFQSLPSPPLEDETIEGIVDAVAADVERIRKRGGEVVFVRPPSSGPSREHERETVPRARTWDRLIARTGALGVHFEDHPSLQGFELPEWGHLAAGDKPAFTRTLSELVRPTWDAWRAR
jgi:hypothetical protein